MGQFYFAWVDETETTFLNAHKREDEFIYDFVLQQSEGDFATLDVTIENPRVGLLKPGRKRWAWFAYEHPTAGTVPLFFGRIVAVPDDLDATLVKISLIARPSDFETQKLSLAATLQVAPYWDPIWFDSTRPFNPDDVLEGRPALWHIDPVTHLVTISNIIEGEDGNIALGTGDVFYDSVRVRYGSPPVKEVEVTATVSWDQKAAGSLDISRALLGGGYSLETYTGEGLINGWPEAGKRLKGGWSVSASFANPIYYKSPAATFEPGYAIPEKDRSSILPFEYFTFDALFQPHGGLLFVKTGLSLGLSIGYDVTRRRSEKLSFTLAADIQSVVVDPGGQDVVTISMQSSELNQPIDGSGTMPIEDERRASYFSTDRGTQSIEFLLAVARARLLSRARCVEVEIEVPFQDAVAVNPSLRKNIIFTDPRMPGGIVTGKITHYHYSLNGDDGKTTCALTLQSTVGTGATVSAVAGTPDYAEDAYVEDAYQRHTGGYVLPALGDVVYMPILGTPPNDDGIDFLRLSISQVVKSVTITNPASAQEAAFPFHGTPTDLQPLGDWSQYYRDQNSYAFLGGQIRPDYDPSKAIEALNAMKTTVDIELIDLTSGPFETDYNLTTSVLVMPRLIDLEAST